MSPGWALAGSVVLGAQAQILLRRGVMPREGARSGWERYRSPWVAGWLVSFAIATLLWLLALVRLDISFAYPLVGTGYVLVVLLAAAFLGEEIKWPRWVAVGVIITGLTLIARSR
jgi:drug/metabolite transporter (DMT)-like permease